MWTWIGLWVAATGAVCAVTGFLLSQVPMGQITWVNRAAGPVLSWGLVVGRGKLVPGVLISWARWAVIGGAVLAAVHNGFPVRSHAGVASFGSVGRTLLAISWVIDAVALMYLVKVASTRLHRFRPLAGPFAALAAVIVLSVALATFGHPWAALTIAGGPILVLGGSYGVFLAVVLLCGKNARWN